jgi:HAD superfamily hydrolase (TIGR01484 family)
VSISADNLFRDRPLLVCDVDDTLLGNHDAAVQLLNLARATPAPFHLAVNSSRPRESVLRSIEPFLTGGWSPFATITAMGTQISLANLTLDAAWQRTFGDWDREPIDELAKVMHWQRHPDELQTRYKASFTVPPHLTEKTARDLLRSLKLPFRTVFSGPGNLDVLPPAAGKHTAMRYLAEHLGVPHGRLMAAGDSMNDLDMLMAADRAIVVGNACAELRELLRYRPMVYLAKDEHARGIIEGLRYFGVVP